MCFLSLLPYQYWQINETYQSSSKGKAPRHFYQNKAELLCTKVFLVQGHLTQNTNFRARLEEFKIGELTKLNKNE